MIALRFVDNAHLGTVFPEFLGNALSYLVIASEYQGPDLTKENLLEGTDADNVLKGLKGISLVAINITSYVYTISRLIIMIL